MRRARILVAEDNPVNQLVARKILEGIGCEVTMAETGLEAVASALSARYDLILMDLEMPEMDGLEATRKILALSADHPVVIACTAFVSPEHRAECRAAGMDDFLGKPVRKEELEGTVERWLGVAREREARAESAGIAGRLASLIEDTDEPFVREITGMFVHTGTGLIETAAAERRNGNGPAAVRAIHSLKGAAGNVGAEELMARCGQLEQKGREGSLGEDDLSALRELFTKAAGEVTAFFENRTADSPSS